jgi:uncharacterized protein YuzB (UPF0349 family)
MLKPTIEFCSSNMHHGTEVLLDKYELDDTYETTEYGCLGNCGECYLKPFALVNGTIVVAETVSELDEKIQQFLIEEAENQAALDRLMDQL